MYSRCQFPDDGLTVRVTHVQVAVMQDENFLQLLHL